MTAPTIYNTFPGGPTRPGEVGTSNRLPACESAGSSPTDPIRQAIAQAQDAHQLLDLSRTRIPQCPGITDKQRRELQLLVTDKFSKLNAAVGYGSNQGRRKF